MAKDTQTIKCVILTLRKENILVPNALVAEIISVKEIEECKNSPDWFLGNMKWRGVDVPLLSFEAAGGMTGAKVNLNTQAVVLYGVGNGDEVDKSPYLALIMSGVPHVSQFSRNQIETDNEVREEHPMVAQKVRINGASISILDVDAMFDMVAMLDELAACA